MFLNVLGCLPTRRVTGDTLIIWVLIDTNVVESQQSGHVFPDAGILRSEVVRHTHVHDQTHWLEGNHALSDIAVGTDGAAIEGPCLLRADEPCDLAFGSGGVLERVGLVLRAIVPAVVEVREGGHGLLVDATTVAVDLSNTVVVDGGEV